MTKRYSRIIIGLLIAALIVAACSPTTTFSPASSLQPSASPVTLTIWHQWTGGDLTAIQTILNKYMDDNPNISIVLDSPQDLKTALQQTVPNGIGPDIISWGNDIIGNYARNSLITDLGSLGITQDYLQTYYEPAAASGVLWQGKIWALPESQEAIAIVYNKALVSPADFPSDPMDFSDLLGKAREYAQANPGKYLICNQGLGAADAYHAAPVYLGFGVTGFVDDEGNVMINTPQAIAAGNWIKEFASSEPKKTSQDICSAGFLDGTFASWWSDPEVIDNIHKAGIDYGILPMGKPLVGIQVLMITNNAVKRGTAAAAMDLIKFFTNADNQVQLTLATQIVPANTAALNNSQVQALPMVRGFGTATSIGISMPTTPYAEAVWAPLGDATEAIWNGTQTPDQALSAAQTAIENDIVSMQKTK